MTTAIPSSGIEGGQVTTHRTLWQKVRWPNTEPCDRRRTGDHIPNSVTEEVPLNPTVHNSWTEAGPLTTCRALGEKEDFCPNTELWDRRRAGNKIPSSLTGEPMATTIPSSGRDGGLVTTPIPSSGTQEELLTPTIHISRTEAGLLTKYRSLEQKKDWLPHPYPALGHKMNCWPQPYRVL